MDVSRRGFFSVLGCGAAAGVAGQAASAPVRLPPTALIVSARKGAPHARNVKIEMDNGEVCVIGGSDAAMINLNTKLEVEMRNGSIENVFLHGRRLEIFRAEC